jgi:hypothetical protein
MLHQVGFIYKKRKHVFFFFIVCLGNNVSNLLINELRAIAQQLTRLERDFVPLVQQSVFWNVSLNAVRFGCSNNTILFHREQSVCLLKLSLRRKKNLM